MIFQDPILVRLEQAVRQHKADVMHAVATVEEAFGIDVEHEQVQSLLSHVDDQASLVIESYIFHLLGR